MITEEFYFRSVSQHGNQKLRRIRAETFEVALEKAIDLYKHVLYFKKTMDLKTALERAKAASLKTKRPYYITVEEDGEDAGECSVQTAPIGTVTHKFVNGLEDKTFTAKKSERKPISANEIPEEISPIESQVVNKKSNSKKVETKKVAKKTAPKKAAKKVEKKVAKVKKEAKPRKINWKEPATKGAWGNRTKKSIAEMVANTKKGTHQYRDPQGVIQSAEYMKSRANQEYVREVYEQKVK